MFFSNNQGTSKLRQQNAMAIFNEIREHEPISRVELYKRTNISKPTVTRIVAELCKIGVVSEVGLEETSTGRKPIMLVLNDDAFYSIGVFLTRRHIRAGLVNLKNEIVSIVEKDIRAIKTADKLFDNLYDAVNTILEMVSDKSKILGVGIGAPGIVDNITGTIHEYGGVEHYKDLKIKEKLEQRFDFEVLVDNNANTRVLAEHWDGFGKGYNNISAVICDSGIGAGIVSEGRILRGKGNIAGEIGHMKVNIDGRLCQCGQKGCVEAYASTYSVENILGEKPEKKITFEQACSLQKSGDETAHEVISTAKKALAVTISNLLGTVNSKMVILSGEFFEHDDSYYDDVVAMVKSMWYGKEYTDVKFHYRDKSNKINVLGAALLVFENAFYK